MKIAVSYSGGKDSIALLLRAKRASHHVLAVTVDTGFLSPAAIANIRRVPDALGIQHVILRDAAAFRRIYRARVPHIAHSPFMVCWGCHRRIDEMVADCAQRYDADETWSGMTEDETTLFAPGQTIADFRRTTGMRTPLCEAPYDPAVIVREIQAAGLNVVTSPLRTNCRMNIVIIADYLRAHGINPYARFFVGQPAVLRRLNLWTSLAHRTGLLRLWANRIKARL